VPTGDVLPLLLMLFGLVAVGQLLRRIGALPDNAPDVLGKLIVRVTMPALIVVILADARYDPALAPMLVANTVALLTALALAVVLLRALGAPRPAQGAAGMVAAFANTAFLGLPFVLAVFPGRPAPATAAVIIDTVDTTILLLTFGTAFAGAMARGRQPRALATRLRATARALATQPMLIAVAIGLTLAAAGVALPPALAAPLAQVGRATPTLAFLTIGLGLDLRSLRGQAPALAGIAMIKLIVAPAIACLLLFALDVRGEIAHVSVLQAAMPTAVVAAIIAAAEGCDARLASAAAVVTTLLSLLTLPLLVAALHALGL
jgi:hypothetical protein